VLVAIAIAIVWFCCTRAVAAAAVAAAVT